MAKKIVIIGGGVTGLSAGIYAKLNGFDTEILEMHSLQEGNAQPGIKKDTYSITVFTGLQARGKVLSTISGKRPRF